MLKLSLNRSVCDLFCLNSALVIEFFALAKPDLELCSALFYIKLERNNRQSLLLTFAEKLHNFALMEQKAFFAQRVAIKAIALLVR